MASSSLAFTKPFYMWAGGKSKLLKHYAEIWPDGRYDRYVEPFFGGGAVFSWVKTQQPEMESVIGDVNGELVRLIQSVSADAEKFMEEADVLFSKYLRISVDDKASRKMLYYELRQRYWDDEGANSALLYVLMKLGFNGIWQTCKAGGELFGTPAGLLNHSTLQQIYSKEDLRAWASMLKASHIQHAGYEKLQFDPNKALIFLDPPYRGSFTTYGTGFDDASQHELVGWSLSKAEEGATVLLANRCVGDERFFEELLPDADFHYFDVVYTAGRRKNVEDGFEAKPAREFLAILRP